MTTDVRSVLEIGLCMGAAGLAVYLFVLFVAASLLW